VRRHGRACRCENMDNTDTDTSRTYISRLSYPQHMQQGGLIESTLHRCRAFKTPSEVACLLAANVASGRAHMDMWRAAKPGAHA
jgi:Xaa-Pro aminopeptidase